MRQCFVTGGDLVVGLMGDAAQPFTPGLAYTVLFPRSTPLILVILKVTHPLILVNFKVIPAFTEPSKNDFLLQISLNYGELSVKYQMGITNLLLFFIYVKGGGG